MNEIFRFIFCIVLFVGPFSVIALKLLRVISWNWWIVGFSPIVILIILGIVCAIAELITYSSAMNGR